MRPKLLRAFVGEYSDGCVVLKRGGSVKPVAFAAELLRAIARVRACVANGGDARATWETAIAGIAECAEPEAERRYDSRQRLARNVGDGIVVQWRDGETYAVIAAIAIARDGWGESWRVHARDPIPNGRITVFGASRAKQHRAAPRRRA